MESLSTGSRLLPIRNQTGFKKQSKNTYKPTMIKNILLMVCIGLFSACAITKMTRGGYEEASHEVLKKDGPIELRKYSELQLVKTVMENNQDNGFMRLFRYIDGQYHEGVLAIDEGVGRVIKALKDSGQDENTLIVFTSDQGFAWGQHGFKSKVGPYHATVAAPFIIRLPG